jgi:hypothetical protein
MELHSFEQNHQTLEASNSLDADSILFDHSLSPNQFDNSLSDVPLLDAQTFQHYDPHSIPFNCPDSQVINSFQTLDPVHQPVDAWQHFPSFGHDLPSSNSHSQLEFHHQRLGSTDFTPSSPANIQEHSEVLFRGPDQQEHTGTIMKVHPDNTYEIQTSNRSYDHVTYHDILKYGSK